MSLLPKYPTRGFGSMAAADIRRIASMGGKTAQANGTAHRFTHEEAVKAGRKGGRKSRRHGDPPSSRIALRALVEKQAAIIAAQRATIADLQRTLLEVQR